MKVMINEYLMPLVLGTISLVVALGTWIFKRQVKKIDDLGNELEAHRLHVSNHYATQADISELKESLFKRWDRIELKMDDFLTNISMAVARPEFETAKDQLHMRINDLEKRKQDKLPASGIM